MINLPEGVELNNLLLFLRETGVKSASILRNFESGSISLYDFGDNSKLQKNEKEPVTAADLTINKLFLDKFAVSFPNIDWEIITEENSKENLSCDYKSDWIWMIDPLDGTKDFIQKTGEYAIHVSLLFKKTPILGMVVLPSCQEIWFGVEGIGTWKENEEFSSPDNDLLAFSKRNANTVITSKNHSNRKLKIILAEMNFKNIIAQGSIGFKICSLLRNEGDIYISISDKTSPKDWDVAAPHSLIKNASCQFTYVSGDKLSYMGKNFEQKGCLIASTLIESEHFKICQRVKSIIEMKLSSN